MQKRPFLSILNFSSFSFIFFIIQSTLLFNETNYTQRCALNKPKQMINEVAGARTYLLVPSNKQRILYTEIPNCCSFCSLTVPDLIPNTHKTKEKVTRDEDQGESKTKQKKQLHLSPVRKNPSKSVIKSPISILEIRFQPSKTRERARQVCIYI